MAESRRSFFGKLIAGGAAVAVAPLVSLGESAQAADVTAVMPMYTAATPGVKVAQGAWVKVGNVLVWDTNRSMDDPNFNG